MLCRIIERAIDNRGFCDGHTRSTPFYPDQLKTFAIDQEIVDFVAVPTAANQFILVS